jgi:hypothetical protein
MRLWKRILAENRSLVTVVAVIIAIDSGLYGFVMFPLSNQVSQSETRASNAETQAGQSRTAYAVSFNESANKSIQENNLRKFYTEVLPVGLAGARGVISPFLVKLANDTNLILERRTSVSARERDSLLAKLRTTMVLAGDYEDIREFIYELETDSAFILIEEVLLSQGNASVEDLVLTLGVSTYYWAQPHTGATGLFEPESGVPDSDDPGAYATDTPGINPDPLGAVTLPSTRVVPSSTSMNAILDPESAVDPVAPEPILAIQIEPESVIPPPSAEVRTSPPQDTALQAVP